MFSARSDTHVRVGIMVLVLLGITSGLWAREDARYQYRLGRASEVRPQRLSEKPERLDFEIFEDPEFSDAGVVSILEYHVVYPLEAEELLAAITAYDDYADISRRVVESDARQAEGEPPYEPVGTVRERHEALMRTSFKFLFFGRDYDYELASMTEELDDGELLVRSRMTRSLDGGLADMYYSWYLKPLPAQSGEERTYVRYFTRVDFAEEPRGLRTALDLFAGSDAERLLESIYRYARTGR
ncbi:MAG: hypothetical protein ACLFUX_07445 [Spirochaetaceae bacterium]